MEKEIIFFENKDSEVGNRPPNYDTNPACGTPNPPPWCGDPNHANIDMGVSFLIFVGLILLIYMSYERKSI